MQPVYRCIQCRTNLTYQLYKQKIWYRCRKCLSGFIPIDFMSALLSEFEFNKFRFQLQKAQIKSVRRCACCQNTMIKIFDVVRTNQVEACVSCQLVWLEPHEGLKIKKDQENEKFVDRKISLRDGDGDEFLYMFETALHLNQNRTLGEAASDREMRELEQGSSLPFRIINELLRSLGLEKLSAQYPTIAFLLMTTLLIGTLKLILSLFTG